MNESRELTPGKYILQVGFSEENIRETTDPFYDPVRGLQRVEICSDGIVILAPKDKLQGLVKPVSFCPSELTETIDLMNSADYKDRFRAEYLQEKIRYEKLKAMVNKWDSGHLEFKPTCPRELYDFQLKVMKTKLGVFAVRAKIEGIEL